LLGRLHRAVHTLGFHICILELSPVSPMPPSPGLRCIAIASMVVAGAPTPGLVVRHQAIATARDPPSIEVASIRQIRVSTLGMPDVVPIRDSEEVATVCEEDQLHGRRSTTHDSQLREVGEVVMPGALVTQEERRFHISSQLGTCHLRETSRKRKNWAMVK
jgi:hypothetical protein